MRTQTSYLLIGSFVISGLSLITAALIVLGAGARERDVIRAETLFDESVSGLEVGAPVRFRGVTVGRVTQISVAGALYHESRQSFVVVRFDLWGPEGLPLDRLRETLPLRIEEGLRVRQASSGITGIYFLEADILEDAAKFPPKSRDWMPPEQRDMYLYVPSAPSAFGQVFSTVERALDAVVQADLPGLVTDLRKTVTSLRTEVQQMHLGELSGEVRSLVGLVNDAVTRASAGFERLLATSQSTVAQIADVTAGVHRWVADARLGTILDGFAQTATSLDSLVTESQALVQETQNLVAGRGRDVTAILSNLERITAQLRTLTATAEHYPSWLFLGSPPKTTPGR